MALGAKGMSLRREHRGDKRGHSHTKPTKRGSKRHASRVVRAVTKRALRGTDLCY